MADRVDTLFRLLELGGAPLLDLFPFLAWVVPARWAGWKRGARALHEYYHTVYPDVLRVTRARVEELRGKDDGAGDGQRQPSLAERLIGEMAEKSRLSDRDLSMLLGGAVDGAGDTTARALMITIRCLSAYADEAKRVHDDIEAVCSDGRCPGYEDLPKLVYTHAFLRESIRHFTVGPVAVPHLSSADDEYKGYRLPRGTLIIANAYAMHHRADEYEEPDAFAPARFLRSPCGTRPGLPTEGRKASYSFGFGRRICPAEAFAIQSLLLAVAKLVWAYELRPVGPINLDMETGFSEGLAIEPRPFEVEFRLRGEEKRKGVVDGFAQSRVLLAELLG